MRKLIWLLLLIPVAAFGQANQTIISVEDGDVPSGGCSAITIGYLSYPGGKITTCQNGIWAQVGSGGGGGDTITSPNSTLTVGGTSTATTLDLNLAHANTWTATIQSSLAPTTSVAPFSFTAAQIASGAPYLLVQPTGTTAMTYSTGGEGIGVNMATGFTGYFFHCGINGANMCHIDSAGNYFGASLTANAGASRGQLQLNTTGPLLTFGTATQTFFVQNTATTPTADIQDWEAPTKVASVGPTGVISTPQVIATGTTPTIAVGAAAGSGATASMTGSNMAGTVTVNSGTSTTSSAVLATITFNGTLTTAPKTCNLQAQNVNAIGQALMVYATAPSTTTWTISVAGSPVPASTSGFTWGYICE